MQPSYSIILTNLFNQQLIHYLINDFNPLYLNQFPDWLTNLRVRNWQLTMIFSERFLLEYSYLIGCHHLRHTVHRNVAPECHFLKNLIQPKFQSPQTNDSDWLQKIDHDRSPQSKLKSQSIKSLQIKHTWWRKIFYWISKWIQNGKLCHMSHQSKWLIMSCDEWLIAWHVTKVTRDKKSRIVHTPPDSAIFIASVISRSASISSSWAALWLVDWDLEPDWFELVFIGAGIGGGLAKPEIKNYDWLNHILNIIAFL